MLFGALKRSKSECVRALAHIALEHTFMQIFGLPCKNTDAQITRPFQKKFEMMIYHRYSEIFRTGISPFFNESLPDAISKKQFQSPVYFLGQ